MSKKLILVGPPGVGKTTLKKVFFEGENSSRLLDYALEPTFGEESLIFRLMQDDIGVFDLAGQENKRWFESEDKSVFNNAGVILVLISINKSFDEIDEFLDKVINVRDEIAPESKIFLLIHKIDLKKQIEIISYKKNLKKRLEKKQITKVYFTSIKSHFFTQTFSYLIEILKVNLSAQLSKVFIETDLINETLRLLYYLNQDVVLSKREIQLSLNLSDQIINQILEHLIKKNHIEYSEVEGKKLYTLTDTGKSNLNLIIKSFPIDNIYRFENDIIIPEFPTKTHIPSFIGFIMADKDGKTFLRTEIYENALKSTICDHSNDTAKNEAFDMELVPMFISALEKFSQEINIKNLSGFNLQGINLKMQIFNFDSYTVTFFTNPNVNINSVEYEIKKYFLDFLTTYKKELKQFSTQGTTAKDTDISRMAKDWLIELNDSYERMILNLEFYDEKQAESLYNDLDTLQDELNLEFSLLIEKIKKLKVKLMKSILDNNFESIQQIAKRAQKLKSKYLS